MSSTTEFVCCECLETKPIENLKVCDECKRNFCDKCIGSDGGIYDYYSDSVCYDCFEEIVYQLSGDAELEAE